MAAELITRELTLITKWLKDSGLSVNENKTEACVFYHKPTPMINLVINNVTITTRNTMNVLGLLFDTTICTLLRSNFYYILYYNSEI